MEVNCQHCFDMARTSRGLETAWWPSVPIALTLYSDIPGDILTDYLGVLVSRTICCLETGRGLEKVVDEGQLEFDGHKWVGK